MGLEEGRDGRRRGASACVAGRARLSPRSQSGARRARRRGRRTASDMAGEKERVVRMPQSCCWGARRRLGLRRAGEGSRGRLSGGRRPGSTLVWRGAEARRAQTTSCRIHPDSKRLVRAGLGESPDATGSSQATSLGRGRREGGVRDAQAVVRSLSAVGERPKGREMDGRRAWPASLLVVLAGWTCWRERGAQGGDWRVVRGASRCRSAGQGEAAGTMVDVGRADAGAPRAASWRGAWRARRPPTTSLPRPRRALKAEADADVQAGRPERQSCLLGAPEAAEGRRDGRARGLRSRSTSSTTGRRGRRS